MNKAAILGLTAFFAFLADDASAQNGKDMVVLRGRLKNFSNQVEVEDLSDLQYMLPPTGDRMIVPDTNGDFMVRFKLAGPNYFRLGRNILYLSPGDDMEVFIDKNTPLKATFSGKGSEQNLYLRSTPFPKAGSYLEAGRNVQRVAQETVNLLLRMAEERKHELDTLKNVPGEFRRLEYARIQADLLNSLLAGQRSYRPRMSADSLASYTTAYLNISQPLVEEYSRGFADASLMKLVVYRDVAGQLIRASGDTQNLAGIKDWFLAMRLIDDMKKVSDKAELSKIAPRIDSVKTMHYQEALKKSLSALLKFGKGDLASDFTAVDLRGNKMKLSHLKGKVIYVDLWATWCGPCLAEMPHFDSLKMKYRDNPGVAFVSLSIDDNGDTWKNEVEKRKSAGFQWRINRAKLDAYNIVEIPRTLLIDKQFRIVDMNAPLPSSPALPEILNQLITK